jgi:uncharacterized membrane protein YczE
MTYCHNCGRITPGDPLYCQSCGRTYDVKLCPRLHPNPRSAEVCSLCGSRELSIPQPKVSFGWRVLEWLIRMALGIVLGTVTFVLVLGLLAEILRNSKIQSGVIVLAVLVGLLVWLWNELPLWVRKFVRKLWNKRRRRHEGD